MRGTIARKEGTNWGLWLGVIVLVLVVAAAVGLAIYGGTVHPVQHQGEQVLPNDRFPS